MKREGKDVDGRREAKEREKGANEKRREIDVKRRRKKDVKERIGERCPQKRENDMKKRRGE